jgi:spore germination cell wall hydrolase CwlJ-like protein
MTDQDLFARLTDETALAGTIWGEARGESLTGKAAVGCVVRNRAADGRWPHTIKDVVLQPKQFSVWNVSHDPNSQAVRLLMARVVEGEPVIDPVWRECLWVANGVCEGYVTDCTQRAVYYLTDALYRLAPPKWASGLTETVRIGAHVFLRG